MNLIIRYNPSFTKPWITHTFDARWIFANTSFMTSAVDNAGNLR